MIRRGLERAAEFQATPKSYCPVKSDTSGIAAPASVGYDPIVLYFHHVGRKINHYTSISTDDFVRVLDLIEEAEEVGSVATTTVTEPRSFAITFDDGYAETIDTALPLMEARGLRCSLFVNTGTIGRRVQRPSRIPTAPVATWRDLIAASSNGHLIGSHGHHHISWADLTERAVHNEIQQSIDELGEHLGITPFAFAYPYGKCPARIPSEFEDYDYYATTREPAAHRNCRPHAIRRVYLPTDEPDRWQHLLQSWQVLRDAQCVHCYCDTRPLGGAGGDTRTS
jgi:peptidoglycan/xylan/chitin deacetylase (PgdA/CDA1 family)